MQVLESLEHGSIIFWQKLWDQLGLSKIIKRHVKLKDKRIQLEVDKYVQMMVINRCVDPLSKLVSHPKISFHYPRLLSQK